MSDFFTASGTPADGAGLQSAEVRAEFLAIETAMNKLPTVTGNAGEVVAVNSGATALEAITTTGTGSGVRATSPTLVTPTIGVATATSINKVAITQPATASTVTVADGKTLTASNTITLTATDGSTLAIGTGGTLGTAAYIAATSKQDVDATLTSIALLGTAADKLAYTTGIDTWAETAVTSFARSILDDANEATFKATVNLEIGVDVQAYDAQLADIAGLTPTDNGVVIGNGTNFVVESGATLKTSLGLTIGTDVQAYDADLTTWAGVTPGTGVATFLATPTLANLNTALSDADVATGGGTATGTNTGDNATNTQYSGLVTNATHTGDATGATALTVVAINGTNLAALTTGILKNATATGIPSIAAAGTDYVAPGGALGTPSSGALDNCTSNTEAAANNSTQLATTAYADRLTAGTLAGAFTTLSATGDMSTSAGKYHRFYGEFSGSGYVGVMGQVGGWNSSYNTWTSSIKFNQINGNTGNITFEAGAAGGQVEVLVLSSTGLAVTGQVSPSAHNTYDLGATGTRWKDLWLQSGAFNGSDARLKTAITPLTTNEINAAKQLSKEIGTYQWLESVQKKGDAARHHVGFTVQRAIEILQLNGCDPFKYGFIGYDKWEDKFVEHVEILPVAAVESKEAVLDVDGSIIEPAVVAVEAVEGKAAWTEHKTVAGDAYSFRYDQLNMFVAAGLEARLAALEAK